MAGEAQETESLRDVISQAVEQAETPVETPVAAAEPAAATPSSTPSTQVSDDRPRDEQGRYLPKSEAKEVKTESAAEPGKTSTPPPPAPEATPALAAVPAIPRPSSWEKAMWPIWDKLNNGEPLSKDEARKLAEYSGKRENDYAKGVSTYKNEFDRVKPLMDALSGFEGDLQRRNIQPAHWIQSMANAERQLMYGAPEQKLSMFLKLAQDYQVPLTNLFVQGQDGRMYFNPQIQAYQPPQQRPAPQQDIAQVIENKLSEREAQRALAAFDAEVQAGKYPHYESVRGTMVQLLEAGFSSSYSEAYDDALRQRQHADLYAQVQQAKADQDKAEAARKAKEQADLARRNNVSPRSSTPAVRSGDGKPRSIRESIETAVEQLAGSDRV